MTITLPPVPAMPDQEEFPHLREVDRREVIHQYIRTMRNMLTRGAAQAAGLPAHMSGAVPGAAEAIQARIDEAQAVLDEHANAAAS